MAQKKLSEASKSVDRHVGMRLRVLRLNHNMSQSELGDSVGVTFQQIQKYERGANRIGASRLWKLCVIFNAKPNYFFEGLTSENEKTEDASEYKTDVNWSEKLFDKQNHRLVTAFDRIKNPETRASVLRLVEALDSH